MDKQDDPRRPKTRHAIICLGGGIEGLEIIKRVDAAGYMPIVVDVNGQSPGIQWARENDDRAMSWQADVYNRNSVSIAITRILNHTFGVQNIIDGVLCCAVDAPDSQAVLAEKYHWLTIGVRQAELAKDKFKQYEWLRDHNIPVPPTKLADFNTPYSSEYNVVKPLFGRGARGVSRYDESNFKSAVWRAIVEGYPNKGIILQRWMDGLQLSTESVIYRGEMVFTAVALRNYDHLDMLYPYVIENGSDTPFNLSSQLTASLNHLILRAALCMGWDNTTVKCDIVLDKDVFYVIEMTPRLSGGYFCSHIIPLCYEFDMVNAAIRFAVGKSRRWGEHRPLRYVCQRFLFPKPEWIGKQIKHLPSPIADEHVGIFTYYRKEGDKIVEVKKHSDRLAQCIVAASSARNARELCEKIIGDTEAGIVVE